MGRTLHLSYLGNLLKNYYLLLLSLSFDFASAYQQELPFFPQEQVVLLVLPEYMAQQQQQLFNQQQQQLEQQQQQLLAQQSNGAVQVEVDDVTLQQKGREKEVK